MSFQFTIIVPVYNEEDNLKRVEQELLKYISIASKKTKILFVNDGSQDNSQNLIEEICNDNADFFFIKFESKCNNLLKEQLCYLLKYECKRFG